MKSFLAGFLLGAVILVVGALGYLTLGLADVRADVPMPGWFARLYSTGIHASVRRTAPQAPNPLPPGDETLIAGGKLYLNDCVGCHGEPGKPPSDQQLWSVVAFIYRIQNLPPAVAQAIQQKPANEPGK